MADVTHVVIAKRIVEDTSTAHMLAHYSQSYFIPSYSIPKKWLPHLSSKNNKRVNTTLQPLLMQHHHASTQSIFLSLQGQRTNGLHMEELLTMIQCQPETYSKAKRRLRVNGCICSVTVYGGLLKLRQKNGSTSDK